MGLGPGICKKCMVYSSYRPHPTVAGRQGMHYCPICGDTRIGHLFEIPESQWGTIDDNTEFLKFMQGVPSARKST